MLQPDGTIANAIDHDRLAYQAFLKVVQEEAEERLAGKVAVQP